MRPMNGRQQTAERIAAMYAADDRVEAVVMAGSSESGHADALSDIDLYVYGGALPLDFRRRIAGDASLRAEVGNAFWEPGDEWVDAESGIHVDVMFRDRRWIEKQLDRVLVRHEASVGYSTCLWFNVLHSRILFDRRGWFARLQEGARVPYPEALRRAVIGKNLPLLRRNLSSYTQQIAKAARRGDRVSVAHRASAFLASWFDVLFAINRLPHPGEKRLLAYAEEHCERRPDGMRESVERLIAEAGEGSEVSATLADALADALERMTT